MRARRHNSARQAIAILGLTALIAGTLQLLVAPAAYAATIVSDDFANLSAWTATRITIDNTIGSPAAPSALANVTSQSASAFRNLPTTTMTPCISANVNRTSGAADLLRMRTAANGPVIKAVVLANGNLQLRSDFGSTTINSNVPIGTGWHNIELCGTVGSNTTWDLFRDGVEIVSDWVANTGTTPVGRIQIGDTAAKTFTVNFDHVVLDEAVGDLRDGLTNSPLGWVQGRIHIELGKVADLRGQRKDALNEYAVGAELCRRHQDPWCVEQAATLKSVPFRFGTSQ